MTTTVLAYIPSPSQGVWYLFGVVPLRAYALCIIAGIVAALVIGDRRWVARGGEQGVIYDIALWAVPFGLIGGRLYHVMTDWPKYFGADGAGFLAALRIWDGGLGIWGAVALGGVGAWVACRRRNIPLPAFGDAVAPGIILAQAIGRLGNYFNQELYGRETDLPWGLTIWERLDPSGVVSPHSLDGVSTGQVYAVVHPTFLYELIWNVLIFVLLIWVDRRFKIGHGRLFALYVAGYCVGRFWVELMRSDTATLIAGIRINTFTSMFVFIAAVVYIMVASKGREDPATLGGSTADGDGESALDDLGESLVAVAATSGVVAAAKVAGDEDSPPPAPDSESVAEDPEASLGLVDGDEAVEAADGTPAVDEPAVAASADAPAEEVAEEPATVDVTEATDVPAVALEGTEVAEALDAEVESEPEAEQPEDGLGSVDGEEVAEAQDDAAQVHEAAVAGADDAEALAEDVAAEPEPDPEVDESSEEATDGLGSVDPDEVTAAEDDAAEVHETVSENAEAAEAAAEEVAAESEPAEPDSAAPGEVAAAESDAAELHETAVENADSAAGAADESHEKATDGLGSVDPDEVTAAEDDAAEVHQTATENAEAAEAAADEVAAESEPAEPDSAAPGEVAATENVEAAEATAEDVTAEPEPKPEADESPEKATDGLGSVDPDEVTAAEDDAAEVHETATENVEAAEATAEDVAAEPEPAEPDSAADDEVAARPEPKAPTPVEQSRRRWWRRG